MILIDQLGQFMGIRAAETFFEPLQLHLQLADLLEQLSLLGLSVLVVLTLLAPGEQLTGAIEELPLPLAYLDRVNGVVSGNLLKRLAATDRLHGDPGLELRAVCAALTHRLEPRSGGIPRLRG